MKNKLNILILLFGIIFLITSFLLFLELKSISDLKEKIVQLEKNSTEKEYIFKQRKSLEILIKESTPLIRKIQSYIIQVDGEVSFIEKIENIAKGLNLNIKIDSIKIDSPKTEETNKSFFENLKLSVTIDGDWNSVFRFIDSLQTINHDIIFDKFEVSNITDVPKDGPTLWQAKLDILVLKVAIN